MLVFEGNGVFKDYVGGFDDWQRQANQVAALPSAIKESRLPDPDLGFRAGPKKLSFNEKRELESLPLLIDQLEKEHEEINMQMASPAHYQKSGFISETKKRIESIERELAAYYKRWEELETRP
jgi:ATP-binding cassette subfamily F protein uup